MPKTAKNVKYAKNAWNRKNAKKCKYAKNAKKRRVHLRQKMQETQTCQEYGEKAK